MVRALLRLLKNLAAASDFRAAGELEGARPLARLAALPLAGLLRDGPPTARLRKLRFACICHRQRQSAVLEYNSSPLEKPCKTRLFENSILCTAKMLGGEAQSKKSPKGLF